jgi:hypothetical protein
MRKPLLTEENFHDLSQPDVAFIKMFQLVIGAAVIADPSRRVVLDRIMTDFRKHFLSTGNETSAAIVEGVRITSTDTKVSRSR